MDEKDLGGVLRGDSADMMDEVVALPWALDCAVLYESLRFEGEEYSESADDLSLLAFAEVTVKVDFCLIDNNDVLALVPADSLVKLLYHVYITCLLFLSAGRLLFLHNLFLLLDCPFRSHRICSPLFLYRHCSLTRLTGSSLCRPQ